MKARRDDERHDDHHGAEHERRGDVAFAHLGELVDAGREAAEDPSADREREGADDERGGDVDEPVEGEATDRGGADVAASVREIHRAPGRGRRRRAERGCRRRPGRRR